MLDQALIFAVAVVRLAFAAPMVTVTLTADTFVPRVLATPRAQPLVVNFWATWCDVCEEEMPDLLTAARAAKLDLALVSLDPPMAATKADQFLDKLHARARRFRLSPDGDPEVFINRVDKTWDGTLPFTVLYDRDGKIVARFTGKKSAAEFAAAFRALH